MSSYIGNSPSSEYAGVIYTQQFSGTGSAVTFTLNDPPALTNNLDVYINGVYQQKNTYSLIGKYVTFSSAPPLGTKNIEIIVRETLPTAEVVTQFPNSFILQLKNTVQYSDTVGGTYTITEGYNGLSIGPLEIPDGITVVVPVTSAWVIA